MEKAIVRAHTRTLKSGKVVAVRSHSDKRTKQTEAAAPAKLTGIRHGEEYPLVQSGGLPPPAPPFPDAKLIGNGAHTGPVWEKDGIAWKRAVARVLTMSSGEGEHHWELREVPCQRAVDALDQIRDLPMAPSQLLVLKREGVTYIGRPVVIPLDEEPNQLRMSLSSEGGWRAVEDTLRQANERHIALNDSVQLGYEEATGNIVIYDWSNASINREVPSEWFDLTNDLLKNIGMEDVVHAREAAEAVRVHANLQMLIDKDSGLTREHRFVYSSPYRPFLAGGVIGPIVRMSEGCDPRIMPRPKKFDGVDRVPKEFLITTKPLPEDVVSKFELEPLYIPPEGAL